MINRLKQFQGEPEERPPEEDYWVVSSDDGWFYVSPETAQEIIRQVRRRRPPRWLRFVDLFGSAICLRSKGIGRVSERTPAQRQADRDFQRARRKEEKEDRRPWEDDDWF